MNYSQSQQILDEVNKAGRILVNCHRSPDPDSVGSALAMRKVLLGLGKEVEVICPDNIQDDSKFLASSDVIKKIDYDTFDFAGYDLFIILDCSEWVQVLGYGKNKIPEIRNIVIDHHFTNEKFGDLNIVDAERSSTCEVLYNIFFDWGIKIDKEIAESLLAGIIFDTSCLQHSSANVDTAEIFLILYRLGADKNKIISNLYRNINFEVSKVVGEVLKNLQIDTMGRFVWSAVPYETVSQYQNTFGAKTIAANLFASSIDGTDFGVIMIEEKKNVLNVSFRAKEGFDISKAAQMSGGGGHKQAGAAVIKDMPFSRAVKKVLDACHRYAKEDN